MIETAVRDGKGVYFAERENYKALVGAFQSSGFEYCSDLCAVDYLEGAGRVLPEGLVPERFEIVVSLTSISLVSRVRIRVQVPDSDPTIASLFEYYPGTEAMEREVFDLMGIIFIGHPDLTRILLPEEWEGHPLRKDYSVGTIPVQFKESQSIR